MSEPAAISVPSSWTRTIIDALLVAGVDVFKVLSEAGFSQDDFRDPNAALPTQASARLWKLAVTHTGDSAFGLEAARRVNQTTFHGLGVAVLASATIRDAMQRLVRYDRLVCDGAALTLSVSEGTACLSLCPHAGQPACHEASDAVFSLIVRVCRLVTNRTFDLELVRFRRATPEAQRPYQQVFRCPIEFGCAEDSLLFDARALETPLVMANAELARRNDEAARLYLERMDQEGIVTLVRNKLSPRLADRPSAQLIARELGMSQRSLQRRLNEAGSGYEALLAALRKEQACALLRENRLNVAELAFALGFEDASAFARAFRRWTGVSPSAYRAEPGAHW